MKKLKTNEKMLIGLLSVLVVAVANGMDLKLVNQEPKTNEAKNVEAQKKETAKNQCESDDSLFVSCNGFF